jgi:hypothetical protein
LLGLYCDTNQEELELVIGILEQINFHPRTREEYIIENSIRTKRVVRDIFFISDKQIRLARRFISSFIYETDTTFSTNTRRLPLAVIVGIDNTGHTFPIAFMFITSESAKSFQFASKCLTDLCLYNCPQPSLVCGDFSKGLGATVALQALRELAIALKEDKDSFVDIDDKEVERASSFLEGDTIVIDVAIGSKGERTRLWLCE